MNFRSRQDWGTHSLEPDTYGRSRLGLPLEVWRPSGDCTLLLFAGIHGEEPETTLALSRALRHLSVPSPQCAVVLAANPDGLIRGTRGNAEGVDLNRNFPASDWQPSPDLHVARCGPIGLLLDLGLGERCRGPPLPMPSLQPGATPIDSTTGVRAARHRGPQGIARESGRNRTPGRGARSPTMTAVSGGARRPAPELNC